MIANREGRNITPSVVYFGADPPAVGQEAKEWARLGNDEIASFFKPHMGSPHYQLRFHGRDYDATDLSALVLRRLKEDAEARLGQAGRPRRHHRAGLLRRRPAEGDDRGRPARRAGRRRGSSTSRPPRPWPTGSRSRASRRPS